MSHPLAARRPAPNTKASADPSLPPIATAGQVVRNTWTTKAALFGVVVCILLGPIGAIASTLAYANRDVAPASQVPAPDRASEQVVAGEYAQRVVVAWLTSSRENPDVLTAMIPSVQASAIAEEPFMVTDPAVAGIEDVDGVWSVTVAATVTDANDVTARRYFRVPVLVAGETVRVLALPAPVAGPVIAVGMADGYANGINPDTAIGQTVASFLGAYLTAEGDVARFTTPGTSLATYELSPYTRVELVELLASTELDPEAAPVDGQETRLLAIATASVTEEQSLSITYALTMTARDERWEISAIDPAPVVQLATPNPTATSTDGAPNQ